MGKKDTRMVPRGSNVLRKQERRKEWGLKGSEWGRGWGCLSGNQRGSCEAQAAVSLSKQTSKSLCVACHIRGSVGGVWGREHLAQSTAHNEVSNGANSNQATIVRCVLTATLSTVGTMAGNECQDRDAEGTQREGTAGPRVRPWVLVRAEQSSLWVPVPGLSEKRLHTGIALCEALGHA